MDRRAELVALVFAAGLFAQTPDTGKTVLDGVYSTDQAARGQAAYTASCSSCHLEDLTGYRGALHGIAFAENFQGDSLDSLFRVTQKTMPRDSPASLTDGTYLDIIAYVLQMNSYPSGGEELKIDALKNIRIVRKAGPEAIPNFALIETIGCLVPGAGDTWTLTRAIEPVKTRNPDASSGAELKASGSKPLGARVFQVLDVEYFQPSAHKGHKMAAKGFLVRRAEGDQINITSLQMLAESCTK